MNGRIESLILQPDGKIIIGGEFSSVGGVARTNIARLTADGQVDLTFNASIMAQDPDQEWPTIFALVLQEDGKILVTGGFVTVNGMPHTNFVRLTAEGEFDESFKPVGEFSNPMVWVDPYMRPVYDGRILVHSGRFNLDGSYDFSFNGDGSYSDEFLALLPNDGILARNGNSLLRLDASGWIDPSFHFDLDFPVRGFAAQPDGKVILGGWPDNQGRAKLVRLKNDGSIDETFTPSLGDSDYLCCFVLALQPDRKILVGGNFGAPYRRPGDCIRRLNPDGTIDSSFNAGAFSGFGSSDSYVRCISVLPDGEILVAGSFTDVAGQPRNNIARLNSNGILDGAVIPSAAFISSSLVLNGAFNFAFTNGSAATYTLLATTNLALPVELWDTIGPISAPTNGVYWFRDFQAETLPQRFYQLRWP